MVADMMKPSNLKCVPQGLIYTMLSRAKTSRGIKICNFNPSHIKVNAGALEEMKRMEAESKIQWISPIEKIARENAFLLGCLNIRSLKMHLQDLKSDPSVKLLDAICLTETHISKIASHKKFEMDNYILTCSKSVHGTGIYVKRDTKCCEKKFHAINIECTCVIIEANEVIFALVTVYRSPKDSIKTFLEEVEKLIVQLKEDMYEIIICGDFNFDLYNLNKATSLLQRYSLKQYISEPSHICGGILDLVFATESLKLTTSQMPLYYSDHQFIFFSVSI